MDEREELLAVGAVQRGAVDGLEQRVEQVGGGPLVAGEPYDAVRRQVGAVGGDGVEKGGTARSRRAR